MAVRGRKPKPKAVKEATGNPGRRPIADEPAFTDGSKLAPPAKWTPLGYERQEWDRIVPELVGELVPVEVGHVVLRDVRRADSTFDGRAPAQIQLVVSATWAATGVTP
jgi:hypothetical protein